MSRRFRWTRSSYRRAHHLVRLLGRFDAPGEPPAIVQRFWALWERYPSHGDPLLQPLRWRHDTDIPF